MWVPKPYHNEAPFPGNQGTRSPRRSSRKTSEKVGGFEEEGGKVQDSVLLVRFLAFVVVVAQAQ